jgi:hypothetical protein
MKREAVLKWNVPQISSINSTSSDRSCFLENSVQFSWMSSKEKNETLLCVCMRRGFLVDLRRWKQELAMEKIRFKKKEIARTGYGAHCYLSARAVGDITTAFAFPETPFELPNDVLLSACTNSCSPWPGNEQEKKNSMNSMPQTQH